MEWIKNRMTNTFKNNTISAVLALVISTSFINVDPSNSPEEEIAVYSQSEKELFEYVTRADEFHEVSKKTCILLLFKFLFEVVYYFYYNEM